MKGLTRLALKNLSRHSRRTLITASAIAVGLGLFIFMDSMLEGIGKDSEQNMILYETASARIVDPRFWEDREKLPLRYSIEDPDAYLRVLEEEDIPATTRVRFSGEIVVHKDPFPEDGSMQVQVIAIDPERDPEVYKLPSSLEAGRFLEKKDSGIMMGAWLAEDLGAELGYPISIVCRSREGYYQTIDSELVGILNTPNPLVNRSNIYISMDSADYYLQMEGSRSQIDISLPMRGSIEKRIKEIKPLLQKAGGDLLLSWKEVGSDYVALASAKTGGSKVILFMVFIIAAVGISNTMLMAVYERIRELGMMRALGMRDRDVRLSFLIEAAGIGCIGSFLGVLFGVLINIPLVVHGIDFSMFMRDLDMGYRITGMMRGVWNIRTILVAFFSGIVLSLAVAYVPTRKALKKEITECLRFE